jgi:hypothetical protein
MFLRSDKLFVDCRIHFCPIMVLALYDFHLCRALFHPHINNSKIGILVLLCITFSRYSGFGTKLSLIFGFARSSKYKPIFPLSQLPKSVVACVSRSRVSCVASGYEDIKVLLKGNITLLEMIGFISIQKRALAKPKRSHKGFRVKNWTIG